MAPLLRRTTAPNGALQRRAHLIVAVTHGTSSRGHLQRCQSGAPEPAEPGPEQQEGVQDSSTSASSLRKYFKPQSSKPSSTSGQGFGEPPKKLAKSGLDPRLQNRLILSNDLTEDQWRAIDAKVNKYPGPRVFTAIGSGGDDFKASVLEAVSAVVGQIHSECVSTRPSAQGTYLSVKMEVIVRSPDQVLEVYQAIRKEPRLKWCM